MNIANIEKHGYLKLIEYTLESNQYSMAQACEYTGLSNKQFNFAKHDIFVLSAAQDTSLNPNEQHQWELSPDSYFNYLQYLEFKHSIESSRKSTMLAIIAIIISGTLALASLFVSINTASTHNNSLNQIGAKDAPPG